MKPCWRYDCVSPGRIRDAAFGPGSVGSRTTEVSASVSFQLPGIEPELKMSSQLLASREPDRKVSEKHGLDFGKAAGGLVIV